MTHRALIAAMALALTAGSAGADYTFQNAFPLLPPFAEPVDIQDPRDGSDRLFVLEKEGRLRVFNNDPAATSAGVFLDIADSVSNEATSGLLGFAFHPDYESNGYLYVVYVTKEPLRTKLSRFSVSADPNVAERASELSVLEIRQNTLNHKAGGLVFGPDGLLHMSVGEDLYSHNARDLTNLKGKLLRIDVNAPSAGKNYSIPPTNPFAGNEQGKREEIWAYGFRNPWRFSFDAVTGRLWLADVGQFTWEEINIVKKGRDYGWPAMEGTKCFYPPVCDTVGFNIDLPLYEYAHTSEYGAAVVGGHVYRGARLPSLNGSYIYTDNSTDEVWGLTYDGVNPPTNQLLYVPPTPQTHGFVAISTDKDRELFFASYFNGSIWQIVLVPSGVDPTPAVASLLIHPNPFAGETRIRYASPRPASLAVYDVGGRLVRRLAGEAHEGEITWDGRDATGRRSASGVYFVRLTQDEGTVASRRVVLLK